VPDHELAGVTEWVGPKNYGLDDAEDGRNRTDTKRKDHNGSEGKVGRLAEPAGG